MNGIIESRLVMPRQVVVYAPHGEQTRFRRARRAEVVAHNHLGDHIVSAVVRVPGCIDDFTVPIAWIDPPGAPEPVTIERCVVIDFRTRQPMQAAL